MYVKSDYEKIIQEELQKKEEMEKMFEKPITDEELFAANTTTTAAATTTTTTTEESTQGADTEDRLFLKLRGKEGDDVVCRVKKVSGKNGIHRVNVHTRAFRQPLWRIWPNITAQSKSWAIVWRAKSNFHLKERLYHRMTA